MTDVLFLENACKYTLNARILVIEVKTTIKWVITDLRVQVMNNTVKKKIKVIFIGDSQCGKSSLLSAFVKDEFSEVKNSH